MASAADECPLRVMCFAPPLFGHALPVLHLAEACVRRGHKVQFCSADYAASLLKDKVESIGAEWVPVAGGLTSEEVDARAKKSKQFVFNVLLEIWSQPVHRLLEKAKPDIVVTDFAALAPMRATEDLRLPLVVNVPGPLETLAPMIGLPSPTATFVLLGVRFALAWPSRTRWQIFANVNGLRRWAKALEGAAGRGLVLVQSCYGLEPPQYLPPNIRMIGSFLPRLVEPGKSLERGHKDLVTWLRHPDCKPTILVSTGWSVALHDWQVKAIFLAIKQAGFRAVWSLQEPQQAHLPRRDDPDFWVSPRIPQAELLHDRNVKALVMQCNWGAVQECLLAGKPVACLPFFGEQLGNAQLLVSAGAAELLCSAPPLGSAADRTNAYRESKCSVETMSRNLRAVVKNPKYRQAAEHLQKLLLASGGCEQAVRELEWAVRGGPKSSRTSVAVRRTLGGNPFLTIFGVAAAGLTAAVFRYFSGRETWANAAGSFARGVLSYVTLVNQR